MPFQILPNCQHITGVFYQWLQSIFGHPVLLVKYRLSMQWKSLLEQQKFVKESTVSNIRLALSESEEEKLYSCLSSHHEGV